MLQVAASEPAPIAAHPDSGVLSSTPFSLDFLLHAIAIWIALIAISIIVFAYRRRGNDNKRGFKDTYHDELEAMRKGNDD